MNRTLEDRFQAGEFLYKEEIRELLESRQKQAEADKEYERGKRFAVNMGGDNDSDEYTNENYWR